MPQLAMVIDLRKCAGCGACAIACKMENNTENRKNGQRFNYADYYIEESGKFPDINYKFLPVLCNHCTDAPCVQYCPANPKALSKSPEGLTVHNQDNCIGCQTCQMVCPFSTKDVDNDGVQYSVISFNKFNEPVHPFWRDTNELIPGCTASGQEVATKAGAVPPNWNEFEDVTYKSVRKPGVTEKCNFCYHRIKKGELPWCVESCPAEARIVGDITDPASEASKLLASNPSRQLKNNRGEFLGASEPGTKPKVYYINDFKTT